MILSCFLCSLKVVDIADKALKKGIDKYHKEKGAKDFYDWLQSEVGKFCTIRHTFKKTYLFNFPIA